jgi:hypothetical protein
MIEDIDAIDLAEAKRRLLRVKKSIDAVYPESDAADWTRMDVADYLADVDLILHGDVD